MIVRPELPPREFDVPCVYRQTSIRRSASLMHDPYLLVSFAATAATYALSAYETQDAITNYVKGEFQRHYGERLEVESVFDFQGTHVTLDIVIGADIPNSHTIEVQ